MPNAYASKICAGKIKDPSGVKRKDFKGRKPAAEGGPIDKNRKEIQQKKVELGLGVFDDQGNFQAKKRKKMGSSKPVAGSFKNLRTPPTMTKDELKRGFKARKPSRSSRMGGGLMEATQRLKRQGLRKGGGVCLRGMNRDAIGKNS